MVFSYCFGHGVEPGEAGRLRVLSACCFKSFSFFPVKSGAYVPNESQSFALITGPTAVSPKGRAEVASFSPSHPRTAVYRLGSLQLHPNTGFDQRRTGLSPRLATIPFQNHFVPPVVNNSFPCFQLMVGRSSENCSDVQSNRLQQLLAFEKRGLAEGRIHRSGGRSKSEVKLRGICVTRLSAGGARTCMRSCKRSKVTAALAQSRATISPSRIALASGQGIGKRRQLGIAFWRCQRQLRERKQPKLHFSIRARRGEYRPI